MTKQEILDEFNDINFVYNNSSKHETLSTMLDELLKGQKAKKAIKPICKIIFDVPYYFCGDCKAMLNMYSTKAKFCSQCGQVVQW